MGVVGVVGVSVGAAQKTPPPPSEPEVEPPEMEEFGDPAGLAGGDRPIVDGDRPNIVGGERIGEEEDR